MSNDVNKRDRNIEILFPKHYWNTFRQALLKYFPDCTQRTKHKSQVTWLNTIIDHYVDMYKFHLGMNIEFIETIYDYATILLVKCYFLEKYATRQVQGTLQGTLQGTYVWFRWRRNEP